MVKQAGNQYVDEIGRYLRDIPWSQRHRLLDDLCLHFSDADIDGDDLRQWIHHFGQPIEYARQLRADAGLASDDAGMLSAQRLRVSKLRPRTVVVLLGCIAFVASVVSGAVWIAHYQPLRFGAFVSIGTAKSQSLRAGRDSEVQFTSEIGKNFAVGNYLMNSGSITVRVTGVALQQVGVPWSNWRVELGPADNSMGSPPAVLPRFAAFELRPGQSRTIVFRGDFNGCVPHAPSGDSTGIGDVGITYEVFGIKHHRQLRLSTTYSVRVGPGCP